MVEAMVLVVVQEEGEEEEGEAVKNNGVCTW